MVSPYFEGAACTAGLGLPQLLGFRPGSAAKPWRPDPALGQTSAWEGHGRVKNLAPFSVRGPELTPEELLTSNLRRDIAFFKGFSHMCHHTGLEFCPTS